ncbi:helix-turn-helix transcriptional regulator [Hyphomicrobium sp.]|jgi:DNA-binding CsgD family transcriptional regulator|uniref:helix-turn-helix transcriptional regulator n=1 Tax=Hyphomicrobium sp. TaxID=82 RepID=UPI002CADEF4C|nr:LuxR C-terminal-related transcriptional regulator [Hyphomicrobium sp.]HVZ04246.1 LuxR C-terminal-related transcriptional regulator [Hyphomicrobium sp.]
MNVQRTDLREPAVHVVLIDSRGTITGVQTHSGPSNRRNAVGYAAGDSYFDHCADEANRADIQALLKRKRTLISFVTSSPSSRVKHWLAVLGIPVSPDAGTGAVLMHVDITPWVTEGKQNTDAPITLNPELLQDTVSTLVGHFAEPQRNYQPQPDIESLSPRQYEVLLLVGAGKSNLEISEELECSLNTVKRHVTAVLQKLHLPNRTRAAMLVNQLNLRPTNHRR